MKSLLPSIRMGCIFCIWPILWKEYLRRGCRAC